MDYEKARSRDGAYGWFAQLGCSGSIGGVSDQIFVDITDPSSSPAKEHVQEMYQFVRVKKSMLTRCHVYNPRVYTHAYE